MHAMNGDISFTSNSSPVHRIPSAKKVYNNFITNCGVNDFVLNPNDGGKNGEGIYLGRLLLVSGSSPPFRLPLDAEVLRC